MRRVRRALAGRFGGKVGKDAAVRGWRKVKADWESWQAGELSGENIVRLIRLYAENAEDLRKKRKAFLAKWRLRCRGVADSLEEARERLFTFLRYPPQQ